jgi:hypothetical protein
LIEAAGKIMCFELEIGVTGCGGWVRISGRDESGSEQDGGIFTLPNVKHGTTPRGLFQKTGDVIRAMYLFIQRPALKRRYDFPGIAQRVNDAVFEREFDRAYKSR